MARLTLNHISKQYKNRETPALSDINLVVDDDEFLVLVGPSGCGKTTLLRMIAGLETASEGEIRIAEERVNELEPQDRGIGMVFQNYALYPHMTIKQNLSFALEVAGMKRKERNEKIEGVSELLDIRKVLSKKPNELSGGERQRVAMGRAMVKECRLFLMDEPLSNLDDVLRSKLRPEIVKLFHELHVPFVYVTHDQVDAMTMGTKIAVMKDGVIQQMGTPQEIYEKPVNQFVAGFIGMPKMNFLEATVLPREGKRLLQVAEAELELADYQEALAPYEGRQVILGVRPQELRPQEGAAGQTVLGFAGKLGEYEYLGNGLQLFLQVGGQTVCALAPSNVRAKKGEILPVFFDAKDAHLFSKETGRRIAAI